MRYLELVALFALTFAAWLAASDHDSAQSRLPFSCEAFPADATEADLLQRFGPENVRPGLVLGGGAEGEYTPGTLIFGDSANAKVEILWRDPERRRNPDRVWILTRETPSPWTTPDGITIGTDLRTIERINRRPFRMFGFAFDGSGSVGSWSGGELEAADSTGCRMRLSLEPPSEFPAELLADSIRVLYRQVRGARIFSSGHPAMQALNPRVYRLFLTYPPVHAPSRFATPRAPSGG